MASVYDLTTFAAAIPLFLSARVLHSYIVEIQKGVQQARLDWSGKKINTMQERTEGPSAIETSNLEPFNLLGIGKALNPT